MKRLLKPLKKIGDSVCRLIDSTIVRAHQHAAGAKGGQKNQAMGRSAGGLSTKLHLCSGPSGGADRFFLTAGQEHDVTAAALLTNHLKPGCYVAADKGYDSNEYRLNLLFRNIEPVIPSRINRLYKAPYSLEKYCIRYRIECFFNRLKQNRAFATRYDKLASTFISGTAFLCTILAIKENL